MRVWSNPQSLPARPKSSLHPGMRVQMIGLHDSPLEEAGFEPSVPRKPRPALDYSLLIMKSLSAADSAPRPLLRQPSALGKQSAEAADQRQCRNLDITPTLQDEGSRALST
jgi:hypothetical protein